ncbi:MAG: M3 family peptidase, partial [Cyanobacteria bacterium]|nr:M3 family peptidase [Cyanobacteriota bacterium]
MTVSSAANAQAEILRGEGLPNFEAITPEAVSEHIPALMQALESELGDLEQSLGQRLEQNQTLSWNDVMAPLQRLGERLRWSWGVVSHLNGVCNSPELR